MKDQELALSGFVDESTAAEIGKLFGAQTAISGKVISYSHKVLQSKPQKKNAAEPFTVRKKREDGEGYTTETKYKKEKRRGGCVLEDRRHVQIVRPFWSYTIERSV